MNFHWNPRYKRWSHRAILLPLVAFAVGACDGSVALPLSTPTSAVQATSATTTSATTAASTLATNPEMSAPVPLTGTITYEVLNEFPHDTAAFTQGLEVVDGRLLESTGLVGQSDRRVVELSSGAVIDRQPLDPALFGEGITERDGFLYQLTWQSNLLIISDAETLEATGETLRYEGEGWGICTAETMPGQPFVMSNGSSQLTVRDPQTFEIIESVEVRDATGTPVQDLNELECVGEQVLANVWQSDLIVAIDLASGAVQGVLDLEELGPVDAEPGRAVLNGIAYRPTTGTYLVTGKLWPTLYEVELSAGE